MKRGCKRKMGRSFPLRYLGFGWGVDEGWECYLGSLLGVRQFRSGADNEMEGRDVQRVLMENRQEY